MCGCYFSARPRKCSYADKQRALDRYLNNVGMRKVARFMGASPALIVRWIKAFGTQLSHQLQQAAQSVEAEVPDVIAMDAISTFVQKNGSAPSYGLLIAEDKVVLLRMSSAKESLPPCLYTETSKR